MSITGEEVLRIARLAELGVEREQLAELASQLSRILDYVAQLSELKPDASMRPFVAGPEEARLRDDVVRVAALAAPLAALAPEFREGFLVVPRLPGVGDDP